ncbi:acyl-coenzyme A thioesterase THEM4-like isoform X1 [Rhineura floridana]|uniref:acyl-coenzyme A thioesterase THEM4-like isoform X1 n=1 Tax=Rhineura floridana TaxID=261503 RepID=UPI002AC808A6|nr:acyl-coenzyme A thioesterase THEM4-like isoform X1 [Rhineura floridana]XP_061462226.1 acyl-coenzyme A thioesterase THEM4-like isoform X1 [Rhineura floridana]XP_061462227.1 acyl-coenzyme A thioesterase THEM4-like isoform X1 [Rhineura floridana]
MLRSFGWLAKGLARWTAPRCGRQAAASKGALLGSSRVQLWNATARFHESEQAKDYALPNSSWRKDMVNEFNKFMEMVKGGTWKKLPSYRNIVYYAPERMRQGNEPKKDRATRLFLRNIDDEGMGFEYAMFFNPSEKRMVCMFQPGPYLEGPSGFAHGGSIATILDATLGKCAIQVAGMVMTAHLSINYKSPIPLGSVVLVDCKLDQMEGRKVFMTGQVQSIDGQTVHVESTALFIQLQAQDITQLQTKSFIQQQLPSSCA